MKKLHLAGFLVVAFVLVVSVVSVVLLSQRTPATRHYTYSVVNVYPHDKEAFTQGLVFENGTLYEGTGLFGYSTLRRVELETGNVLLFRNLSSQYFGEGITVFGDKIIQITWQSHIGFEYDKDFFALLRNFAYATDGWGLTSNGTHLIMSDGTANLYFLDPETFETVGQVAVRENGNLVTYLNELEYVKGEIYANIWKQERVAIIDPKTGQVTGWIDLSGIYVPESQDSDDVLNGIAYDEQGDRLFVTGKRWSQLFEVDLVPVP